MEQPAQYQEDQGDLSEMNDHSDYTSGNMEFSDEAEEDSQKQEHKTLGRKEAQKLFIVKVIILITALVATAVASAGVYFYALGEEEKDFQNQFMADGLKVLESFHEAVYRKLGVMDAFSTSLTLYALENNLSFPFVTLPYYELKGASTRVLSEGIRMDYMLLVTDELRPVWEEYAEQRHVWLDKAIEQDNMLRRQQDERFGLASEVFVEPEGTVAPAPTPALAANETAPPVVYTSATNNYNTRIYGKIGSSFQIEEEGSGPFMVVWQISPATPNKGILNLNLLHSGQGKAVRAVMETGQAILGEAIALKDPNDESGGKWNANFLKTLERGQYRHTLDSLEGDPTSGFMYPVFDSFDTSTRKLVGGLRTTIFWKKSFTNILPDNSKGGIVAVLSNTQNQTFSYRVDGSHAKFLGPGDHHDSKYDDMVLSQNIDQDFKNALSLDRTTFTQADLSTEHCGYTLSLYPSSEMEDEFLTNGPAIFAVVVVLVFLVTVLIFKVYDCLVEQRQSVVMNRAVASGALISTLFPEHVKNQLIEEKQQKAASKKQNQSTVPSKTAWHAADNNSNRCLIAGNDGSGNDQSAQNGDIIADRYEESSILFCDLVGFTQWSSTRKPEQVFLLLEAIFGAFDKAAARRRVYKVETIGDCYVAVTGVPKFQANHAVILVRFAHECQSLLKKVTMQLADQLGEETQSMQARIGIHSGPVTAGVLRGRGSRFQLFGDSMNTASRCESNGAPGRIQVTQETADLLIAAGKASWLTAREELVYAKGKGDMQFYWVQPRGPATQGTQSSDGDRDTVGHDSSAFVSACAEDATEETTVAAESQ